MKRRLILGILPMLLLVFGCTFPGAGERYLMDKGKKAGDPFAIFLEVGDFSRECPDFSDRVMKKGTRITLKQYYVIKTTTYTCTFSNESSSKTLSRILMYERYTINGKTLHVFSELAPDRSVRYRVALPNGSETAYILSDPGGKFSVERLRYHIISHLQQREENNMW